MDKPASEQISDILQNQPKKDLYELGELPPLGHVPGQMYAWAIRRERHANPDTAMQVEVVPTPEIGPHEALVMVMAAGVNYNGIWASLGKPISPFDVHKADFHMPGLMLRASSGRLGIRLKTGKSVMRL